MMSIALELGKIVGKAGVIDSKEGVRPFSVDKSYLQGALPLAVVKPRSAAQISKIMKLCNKKKINAVVRGGGSALTGSSVPIKNTIVIDMSGLGKILEVQIDDQYAVVEPGVTVDELNKHLSKLNYLYPPEPASSRIASIGGTISTNAGGMRAVMYGSTKNWILGLEVVLPTGEIIQTGGRTLKRSVGYDLTSLFVGSEGTLGIVTKAIVKIVPKPGAIGKIAAYYTKVEDAVSAVERLKHAGMPLIGAELVDRSSIDMLRAYNKLKLPNATNCMLMIDIASTPESLGRMMELAEALLRKSNPIGIEEPKSKARIDSLYHARTELFNTAVEVGKRTGRSVFISDVIVPTSKLPQAVSEINTELKRHDLEVQLFSHIGDGNIHVNIIADKNAEIDKVEELLDRFAQIALSHQGSVSGEHGIGIEKKELMLKELRKRGSMIELEIMRKIKKALDPNSILNKGKVFD